MAQHDDRILSEERLKEIAELEAAATPGVWVFKQENEKDWAAIDAEEESRVRTVCFFPDPDAPPSEADAAFIAAARTDVPDLIGMVRALQEQLTSRNAALERIANMEPQVSSDDYVTACLQAEAFFSCRTIARKELAHTKGGSGNAKGAV